MYISDYTYSFFFLGMFGKFYDDLTELYLIKNEKLIETTKTCWTLLIFYFMIYYAKNKYDILWMMFVWTFLPLVDWIAFTEDPYLFSLVIFITAVGMLLLTSRNYLSNLKWNYLIPCFILYCICAPITEIFCFKFNGPLNDICKTLNLQPDIKIFKNLDLSDAELEVSFTKLITRIISIIFLLSVSAIAYYFMITTVDEELSQLLSSVILLAVCNSGYFVLSVINQYYSIYINPEVMKKHHKQEKTHDVNGVIKEKELQEKKTDNSNKTFVST
jgi:hypothetical protein